MYSSLGGEFGKMHTIIAEFIIHKQNYLDIIEQNKITINIKTHQRCKLMSFL